MGSQGCTCSCAILPRVKSLHGIALLLVCLICTVLSASAQVVRVEVTSRTDVLNGQPFGAAGTYERIVGPIYFSVSVANAHNQPIVGPDKAVNLKESEAGIPADF